MMAEKERVEFVSMTPPQYGKMVEQRNFELVLEERLMHFIRWCAAKKIRITIDGKKLNAKQCQELVDEYVNEY